MQNVSKIVSILKEIALFESDSDLVPQALDWKEGYKTRKKILKETLGELENIAEDSTEEIIATFNFCENSEDYDWSAIFLAEMFSKYAKEDTLEKIFDLYLSGKISSHSVDAIHDGLVQRDSEIDTYLIDDIEKRIKWEEGEKINKLLQILSKIRSNEAFDALKKYLNESEVRGLLPEEDFLNYFLNQGKGIDVIQTSDLMEKTPKKAEKTIEKLENELFPTKEELLRLPNVEYEDKDISSILEGVWGYEATVMDSCEGCGKETKSHILPKGEVMCHSCWKDGKGRERIDHFLSMERKGIRETIEVEEAPKKIYQQITELSIESGELKEAKILYDKILEKFPEDFSLLSGYGELLHKMGDEKEQDIYERMIQIRPYDTTGYQKLGKFYVERGAYEDAIAHFTRALELSMDAKTAFPEEVSLDTIAENVQALTEVVKTHFPDKCLGEEPTKGIREKGLLNEEEQLFETEMKREVESLEKLTEKLKEMETLRRKLKLDEKREEERLDEGVEALMERNLLHTLRQMVEQYPPEEVISQLDSVANKLEKEELEGYLIKLLSRLTIPRAIPVQYAFLDLERFGKWVEDLIHVLADHGEKAFKFLAIELQAGRVPLKTLPSVWNILTEINEQKALENLLLYIEKRKIKPTELTNFEWDFVLRDLVRFSDENVGNVYEKLKEKVQWSKPAREVVEQYYNQWKQRNEKTST